MIDRSCLVQDCVRSRSNFKFLQYHDNGKGEFRSSIISFSFYPREENKNQTWSNKYLTWKYAEVLGMGIVDGIYEAWVDSVIVEKLYYNQVHENSSFN